MLTPQQSQALKMFQSQPKDKQAQILVNMCNEKNISKDELTMMNNILKSLGK